jgi:hypothetical protein
MQTTTITRGQSMMIPMSAVINVMTRISDEEIKSFVSKNLYRIAIVVGLYVRDFPTWDSLLGCLTSEYMREYKQFLLEFIDQQADMNLDYSSARFIQLNAIIGDEAMRLIPDEVLFHRSDRQAA